MGVLLALAGCGGSERQATSTPAPTASPTPARQKAMAGSPTVRIKGFAYTPAKLTARVGAKVTWIDEDASNHTVTFSTGPGDLGNVDEGGAVSATFEQPGTYAYVCQYHPNMKGTIAVR